MSECPTTEQLAGLLAEKLSGQASAALENHIEHCPRCQAALADLSQVGASDAMSASRIENLETDAQTKAFLERVKKNRQRDLTVAGWNTLSNATGGAVPGAPAPLPTIDGYEILSELGRGGMGVVFTARHLGLNRLVAVKMLPAAHFITDDSRQRFRREAQAIGRLHHPNIVQIFDFGETSSGPFLSLELVKTGTLAQRLNGSPWKPFDAARFVERLAEAVYYAHEHGVIHRDLKPANVLVAIEEPVNDGTPPALVPKITDFGLAKCVDESLSQTPNGTVLGTPSYLAPEQVARTAEPLGPPTDVYGLGAILYELLTGAPPFRGDSVMSTLLQVTHQEPTPPSRLGIKLPRDLETICLKCLEKSPKKRYATAGQLAADLHRVLNGESILARPPGVTERTFKWVKRHPALTVLAAGLILASVAGSAAGLWFENNRRTAARERQVRAERVGREVEDMLQETISLYGQAQGADRNLKLWGDALASVNRAESTATAGEAPPHIRKRVATLLAEIETQERQRRLIATLADIQASMGDDIQATTTDQDFPAADAAYAKAFQGFDGTNIDEITAEQGAALLRSLGDSVRVEVAAALDNWGYIRFVLKKQKADYNKDPKYLHNISRMLDPDPLRNQIRDAIVKRDQNELLALAAQMSPAEQPVQTVNLVGVYLYWYTSSRELSDGIAFLQKAQRDHTDDFQINHNLAYWLIRADRPDEAIPYARAATAIRRTSAVAWQDLADALRQCGHDADAIAAHLRTASLAPRNVMHLYWAGYLLERQEKKDEALSVYREAARRVPKYDPRRYNRFTNSWKALGLADEVVAEFRKALAVDPDSTQVRQSLCTFLYNCGRWTEFVPEHALLAAVKRGDPEFEWFNGTALFRAGQYEAAIAAYEKSLMVDPNFARSRRNLEDTKRVMALEERLPGIIATEGGSNAERLELAAAIQRWKARHLDAVRLYQQVFATDPATAEALDRGYRYDAACSAALAGTGVEIGANRLSDDDRKGLRGQALDWLTADLAARARQFEAQPLQAVQFKDGLRYWQRDIDLAPVREPELLSKLPDDERTAWMNFWNALTEHIKKADSSYSKSEYRDFLNHNHRERSQRLKVVAGATYRVDMESPEIKCGLRIENNQDDLVAEDNIDGGRQNSSVTFTAPADGTYNIFARSPQPTGAGAYTITILEFPASKN